jgi:broad specificity phosphatase PhoE
LLALALLALSCEGTTQETTVLEAVSRQPPTVFYLLRHAEATPPPYEESAPDPSLVERGRARAAQLAHVLRDAGVTRIRSSDFNRTRETAQPLADTLSLPVELYNPNELQAFADELKQQTGRIVIVGHSNTTPALVEMLGGEPGEPIDEQVEFDRLYVVTRNARGETTSHLLRYGPAAQP